MQASRDLDRLHDIVSAGGVLVLSGAGLSTESGIPDYRGPRPAGAPRPDPVPWARFRDSEEARRRYWARSYLGWPRFREASPNTGHRAVVALQQRGLVAGIVTQNVDGLHQAAGSGGVVDLHGRLDRVRCLGCRDTSDREELQLRLAEANPMWQAEAGGWLPDGDVELTQERTQRFVTVGCGWCGGALKPDVVFFGESIPAASTAAADAAVDGCSSLLVLGSSLTVFSGRRLVRRAAARGCPVVIVNRGPTRGDDLATVRVDDALGPSLRRVLERLGPLLRGTADPVKPRVAPGAPPR